MPERPRVVTGAQVPLAQASGLYVARTYAYVAAGKAGLAIIDIERPEQPRLDREFNADGAIADARDVKVGMTNVALFAYVADGANGLQVIELSAPDSVPGNLGFSPRPNPRLVGRFQTGGEAIGISEGYRRDRAVDESGNQIAVFGRRGARPFNLQEMQKLFLRGGTRLDGQRRSAGAEADACQPLARSRQEKPRRADQREQPHTAEHQRAGLDRLFRRRRR